VAETTAVGTTYAAGLAAGVWDTLVPENELCAMDMLPTSCLSSHPTSPRPVPPVLHATYQSGGYMRHVTRGRDLKEDHRRWHQREILTGIMKALSKSLDLVEED